MTRRRDRSGAGTASMPGSDEDWHTRPAAAALESLDTAETGLSSAAAATRLGEYGPNRLPEPDPPSVLRIFARQFRSPLIYILAVAAAVSLALGEYTDAGFIVVVVLADAVIGGFQEWHAEQSIQALQHLIKTRATVLRDGEATDIDSHDVVPGDVLVLEPGTRIPADLRLLSTDGLEVDESTLTGESTTVGKAAAWLGETDTPIADRENMAYAGTTVTRGRGRGVVVATGDDTVVGDLARNVVSIEGGEPPLVHRMQSFTRSIGLAVLVLAVATIFVGVGVRGFELGAMFLFAVALMVAAIPEGLPVSMTVALGVATRRMARVGVIVRRMVAVEGLGSCTYIASDKTGTLTENELTVRRVVLPDGSTYAVTGQGYDPTGEVRVTAGDGDDAALDRLARAATLCNEASLRHRDGDWTHRGDPTDVAVLAFARKLGWDRDQALDSHERWGEIPFEPERRYAATFHTTPDGTERVFVKGAPERVLGMCAFPDDEARAAAETAATRLAREGYRVLAVADGATTHDDTAAEPPSSNLEFRGFVGMIDPLRAGAADAITRAQAAGIEVAMVTGDHPETALAIAQQLGLADSMDEVLTGREFAGLDPAEVTAAIADTRVFARVSPDQKIRIVEAAQDRGHFVAVTGDGVNDAPALRSANIGIAMGDSGTDVARDTAELVLSDDNFASIVAGIEQGRIAFDNIRKVIYMLISTNASEIVLVVLSLLVGLPLPLTAVQLLWLNIVTEGGQDVALGFEPGEGDVLDRPPRDPAEPIFDRLMLERTAIAALVMGSIGLLTFQQLLAAGASVPAARNGLLLLMVLFENVHVGNSRSETRSLFGLSPLGNPILVGSAVLAFGMHLAAMYVAPIQAVLGTAPVAADRWSVYVGLALVLAVAMELHKVSWRRRHG